MIPLCPLCLSPRLCLSQPHPGPPKILDAYYECPRCKSVFSKDSAIQAPSTGNDCRVCNRTDAALRRTQDFWVRIDLCSRCA